MLIRIGTRGSKLALWQTYHIAQLLQKIGVDTDIHVIETKGDKILHKSLSKIGSKGLFTDELEAQLREKTIDIAVHSAKDVQSLLDNDLELLAFSEREKPHDVLISFNKSARLENFDPSFIVGTSSTRRIAQIRYYYPNVRIADVRGNLQTRMKKLEKGNYDALILAYAGVHRMNLQEYIVEELSTEQFTPAVGQGTIAIESLRDLPSEKKNAIRNAVNHTDTEICLLAERSFLKTLQGGCSVPIFGLAHLESGVLKLKGGIMNLNGNQLLVEEQCAEPTQAENLGQSLAENLLAKGGGELLKEIKNTLGV
ncbi:MAG: hydroxymethylbilane synthase [Microscillaceae bacterium]|nr:hydroxymethylbilane synthase [Microscillaceae bacterium]